MKRDTFRRCRLMVAGVGTYAHVNSAITSMCRGGTLAMFDPRVGSTTELVGFLTEHDVTSLSVTPTMAHAISRATGGTPVDAPVEYVNVRGERVGGNDLKVLHQLFPFAQIAHMYATTETSRIALWTWNIGDPVPEGLLPLGPPSEGCIVRFVGADGEVGPAPRGQPEELLVRAPTIFDGYVGRDPDDGFVVAEGQRWYRTGDLVSVDDEGSLRVHGRVGRRVKVAGQFVDLDDVANAFERLDGVARAAVTYFDVGESARLVGHLVPERGIPLDTVALRARLADDLPIHMVPSLVRIVDEPPLNRSGKIDHLELARWRPALPDHSAHDRILEMSTPTEARLLSLATTLVGRPVTLDDDLIDVGMVSVAWVELVERIKADFGTDVELGELLAAPTVRGIATLLDAERPERSLVALSAGSGLTPIVWVPNGIAAQEAIPLSRALPGHPVYVPLLKGFGRPGRIALRVDDVVADMAEAIEAELPSGGFALAGFSAGCHHAQALAARLAADGRDVELLILLDPPSGRGGWRAVLSRCKRELEAVAAKPHLRRHVAGTEVCHPKWLWWAMRRDQVRHRPPVYDGATLVVRTSQMAGRPAPVSLTGPVWVERVVGDHLAVITDVEPVAGHIVDALAAGRSGSGQRADSAS
jgi:aryl carrier-like protein